jgi:thiol-disulfide isomerase/thioredoxin
MKRFWRRFSGCWLLIALATATAAQAGDIAQARLSGPTTAGVPFDLSHYRGKVVMVNFWATWCPACRADWPVWQEVYEWYQDNDFEVVAVSIDRDRAALDRFVDNHAYTIPVVWRFDADEDDSFPPIRGTPTTYFVGRDGEIASHRRGRYEMHELMETVEALLQR